jgi:hypothetical protein
LNKTTAISRRWTESVQRSTEPANDDLLANTLRNLAVAMTLTLLAR